MLKALELVGFKSFADRTRFEFPPGITVIVGPNGSGKSNIVDAIKWVLGEQSVKSLRGQEMSDVIFNGSGTRRGMNSAEITLTLDNSRRLLPIDAAEVQITRRIYRGGEGEYLINRNPARLRDIRDLLAGTGLGALAYCVIEQGRVDALLQSSPADRRVILEEAAGISRFRVKKLESLRRLERVEQNLLRLKDIVDEVENRLRTVRQQAGKARRYKHYAERLQQLRTQVALVDWRRFSQRLAEHQALIESLDEQRDSLTAATAALEARLSESALHTEQLNLAVHQIEAQISTHREKIASAESAIAHQHARLRDLEEEIARYRRQSVATSVRAGQLEQQFSTAAAELDTARQQHEQIAQRLAQHEQHLAQLIEQLEAVRAESHRRRAALLEKMRWTASLESQLGSLESRLAAAESARQRCGQRLAEVDSQLASIEEALQNLGQQAEQLAQQAAQQEAALSAAAARLAELQSQYAQGQQELAQLQRQRTALAERAAVLEELQRREQGLAAGVEALLNGARSDASGHLTGLCGMVADVIKAPVETAPLIDAALGPAAAYLVVESIQPIRRFLEDSARQLSARVGFVFLDSLPRSAAKPLTPEGQPGVVERADRLVETEPRYRALAEHLLGRTWVVRDLAAAFELARALPGEFSFVTLAGELLAADGTLIAGPRSDNAGLISRRSQLRAVQEQLAELDAAIARAANSAEQLQQQIAQQQQQLQAAAAARRQTVEALAERRLQITSAQERRIQTQQQHSLLAAELQAAEAEHSQLAQQLAMLRPQRQQAEALVAETEAELATLARQTEQLEARRQELIDLQTQVRVELATSQQRLSGLRATIEQLEQARQERQQEIVEIGQRLAESLMRAEQSRWEILRAESEIAELYLAKEKLAAQVVGLLQQRQALLDQHSQLQNQLQQLQAELRKIERHLHAEEMAAGQVGLQRTALADRLREEYNIDLPSLEKTDSPEDQRQREEVQEEIDQLRRKLNNLGNVNLEALDELEQLESRYKTLSDQYHDLTEAKTSLERIIQKINADSRRLFAETLERVRGHFQSLFRELFGGGFSDIVLEEGVDILESGIEIVARPPGKELRSISLLSGGEKTLTAVALLLAIFRSHPSPFCVLDEVDAALDEANIDRFTHVLREFLSATQFIIVTHSKKTMTCANTIYGVTMQESGVSKQVSVRFEDVSEDGQILVPAA